MTALAALVLAAVLSVGAVAKLADRERSAEAIAAFGVPHRIAGWLNTSNTGRPPLSNRASVHLSPHSSASVKLGAERRPAAAASGPRASQAAVQASSRPANKPGSCPPATTNPATHASTPLRATAAQPSGPRESRPKQ